MANNLVMTNTFTGKKEPVSDNKELSMYVCGVTPYDYAHVGHGRCYVTFDILYRLLSSLGHEVAYCRNFTDVDDKLINRAIREFNDPCRYPEIATRFINMFHEDMQLLNCLPPTYEPRVTDNIPQIIALVQHLIDNGNAYVADHDVYFSIDSFPDYGKLSKRCGEDLLPGARVSVNDKKKNPLDFALWKHEPQGPSWPSPWGPGRPGWHIECSVMAKRYLGDTVDIHGGGMDLIFPHHENELAQSEAASKVPFVKLWVHNAFVRIDHEKMSKSLGNFFTLRDVFTRFDPMIVRYLVLSHHYRSPLDFAFDDLNVLQKSYQRLCKLFVDTKPARLIGPEHTVAQKMLAFLCDDLNTPGLLGVIFEHIKLVQENPTERAGVLYLLRDILGLTLVPLPEKEVEVTPEMQELLDEREQARAQKDWKRADKLRDELKKLGYDVSDKKI